jgi:probable rRNA maturation factor
VPTGNPRPRRDVRVSDAPRVGLRATEVARWVRGVLSGEEANRTSVSVSFLDTGDMRTLNRDALDRDTDTDVIAFRLDHPNELVGDVYVCAPAAERQARQAGITVAEEATRLVVHGVLHVLGHDHPEGADRTGSAMWAKQEEYVRRFHDGGSR